MKLGFKTAQMHVDWDTLAATWDLGDQLEVFDSGWLFDHFVAIDDGTSPSHEAWTLAAALAARTKRLTLGHLVLGNTYRYPPLLAKMAVSLDHVAKGRFILGLGAGHRPDEHAMFGWELPPIGERLDRLESAIRVLKGLWSNPSDFSTDAPPYRVEHARLNPPPFTPGGPRLWLGTQGVRRGLRLVAEYADGWNAFGSVEEFRQKREALKRHCEALGRAYETIEVSAQIFLREDDTRGLRDLGARYVADGVDHLVLGLPAQLGPSGLERLAQEVAVPLREQFGG